MDLENRLKRENKFKEEPVFYIDFDNTLLNTVKIYCDTYNSMFYGHADWTKSKTWNLEDECPPLYEEMSDDIFDLEMWGHMRNYKKYYYDGAIDFVDYACRTGKAFVVTVGTDLNIINKAKFLNDTLNEDLGKLYIVKKDAFEIKSKIDMSDGIIIDDRVDVLNQSNALYKVRFGEDFEWNKDWKPNNITTFSCRTWDDMFKLMERLGKR